MQLHPRAFVAFKSHAPHPSLQRARSGSGNLVSHNTLQTGMCVWVGEESSVSVTSSLRASVQCYAWTPIVDSNVGGDIIYGRPLKDPLVTTIKNTAHRLLIMNTTTMYKIEARVKREKSRGDYSRRRSFWCPLIWSIQFKYNTADGPPTICSLLQVMQIRNSTCAWREVLWVKEPVEIVDDETEQYGEYLFAYIGE